MDKNEILILCMIILSVLAIVCSFVFREKKEDMFMKEEDTNVLHDWESKFIIKDGYNVEVYYINENKCNNTKAIIIELKNKKVF